MIYIFCDMNCNNSGNYFRVIGLKKELEQDESSYIVGNTFYPKGYCYEGKIQAYKDCDCLKIRYSEVIDYLLPKEYKRWKQKMEEGK